MAQVARAPEFRAYPLRHAAAAELEATLSELLGAIDAPVQLVVDAPRNQFLLAGPPEAHRIAGELVASLDRPVAAAEAPAASLLKAYPFAQGDLNEAAARLESMLGPARARVTPDARTSQLLVFAPAEVHAGVPAQLALLARAAPAVGAAPPLRTAVVTLGRAQLPHVEQILREMLAARLVLRSDSPAAVRDYSYSGPGGARIEIRADSAQNGFVLRGPSPAVAQFERLLHTLDEPATQWGRVTRIVPLGRAEWSKVRQAVDAYRGERPGQRQPGPDSAPADPGRGGGEAGTRAPQAAAADPAAAQMAARFLRSRREMEAGERYRLAAWQQANPPGSQPPPEDLPPQGDPRDERGAGEAVENVQVESLPDLDVIILRGNQREVEEVIRIIQEIERLSAQTEPSIEVVPLEHAPSEKLAALLLRLKPELMPGRQGAVSVTALVKPNAILLVGSGQALRLMQELVRKLDQPVDAASQVQVFRLRFAPAAAAQATIEQFFATRTGLGPQVIVEADPRTNSLIVQASPRDLEEVRLLVERIDIDRGAASNELRIFRLRNTLAGDLAPVLTEAIGGGPPTAAAGPAGARRSAALSFLTVDARGQRLLESGLLGDVRITPDPRTNTLLISAPAESMDLLAALVEALDAVPASQAEIKVFKVVNGDATELVLMLRTLLGLQAGQPPGPQLAVAEGEASLAPLRFSVDTRTNSIIASGSSGDLAIVEAILLRLDESDSQDRKSQVFRLKNAPAGQVAIAINEFLRSERQVELDAPGAISAFRQIEREVVVVPEEISNSLIISATPRYFDEIYRLIQELDAEPPKVLIQVLIAEVRLRNTDEFGVELGIQDALLFDRSLLGNSLTPGDVSTVTNIASDGSFTNQVNTGNGGLSPGFNFNNQPLGNATTQNALRNSSRVGGQGLSHFSLNRLNNDLGFGGLVLSASSESVSVLLRALKASQRLEVLSRPQVMTLDNQPAFVQVGQRVPRVTNTQVTNFGLVNSVELENVGLILGVTPRVSPEGLIVMEVDTEKSQINRTEPGIPISAVNDTTITSPIFDITTAQTTVSASSGQTIILGGLITKSTVQIDRRVPLLSSIPVVGALFRYHFDDVDRRELLIVLTPHIVRDEEEAEALKQAEAERMHWCLADVHAIHGDGGLCQPGQCPYCDAHTTVIYPDLDPHGQGLPVETPETIEAGPRLSPVEAGQGESIPAPQEQGP